MNELMPNAKKFVYVTQFHKGHVDFYFAVGEAATNMELRLPYKAFIEFCQNNRVLFFTKEQEETIAAEELLWREGVE